MPCADTAAARDHPHLLALASAHHGMPLGYRDPPACGPRLVWQRPPEFPGCDCSAAALVLWAVAAGYSVAWEPRSPSTSGITISGITTGRKISCSQSNSLLPSKPVQSQPCV